MLRRKLIDPLVDLLRQGLSPARLALCVSLGIAIGLIPVLGVSTLLCTAIALAFRLNLPAIQLAQAAMAPLQILLIVPFVRLGEWMLGDPAQAVTVSAGLALLRQGVWHAVVALKSAIVHAALAWLITAPPFVCALFALLRPVFEHAAIKLARRAPNHEDTPQ